jgi:midasin (ATPase involved in ribosome maturation)
MTNSRHTSNLRIVNVFNVNELILDFIEQRLGSLLDGGSLVLTERGDIEEIPRHPNFKLFGSMNPPSDFGKRELPSTLRNR